MNLDTDDMHICYKYIYLHQAGYICLSACEQDGSTCLNSFQWWTDVKYMLILMASLYMNKIRPETENDVHNTTVQWIFIINLCYTKKSKMRQRYHLSELSGYLYKKIMIPLDDNQQGQL